MLSPNPVQSFEHQVSVLVEEFGTSPQEAFEFLTSTYPDCEGRDLSYCERRFRLPEGYLSSHGYQE